MSMYEWSQDAPQCPEWCSNGAEHMEFQVRGGNSYWHQSKPLRVHKTDQTYGAKPTWCEVFKTQQVQVDERGFHVHPIELDVGGMSFTPQSARRLAELLLALSDI